jgi:ElaB/YqjD/DUF883 family membrane-anchored ribosome-binding protein
MTTDITTTAGAIENTKDMLVRDIKGIVGKADHLLKDAGQTVSDELSATRHAIADKACAATSATDAYVHNNPWKIVGVAAAVGVFIGALISRR